MPIPVIIDCDTGTDDAVAIMLAALHPELDLLGVTTVWGNHDVHHTTDNSLRVLDLVGRGGADGVGVHPGRNAPIRPRLVELPSGRDDLEPTLPLPEPTSAAGTPAVEWLLETVRASPQPVTLVATGPLTNLAAALEADPTVTRGLGRVVVLGGSHRERGVTAYAERNVWCDPEAAHDVFTRVRDLHLVTMDATFSAALTAADTRRLRASGTPAAVAAADLVDQRIEWYQRDDAMRAIGGAPLHDPLAVAAVVVPGLLTGLRAEVEVERRDPTTYGATRFRAEADERKGRLEVSVRADRDRYVDLLCDVLSRPASGGRPASRTHR